MITDLLTRSVTTLTKEELAERRRLIAHDMKIYRETETTQDDLDVLEKMIQDSPVTLLAKSPVPYLTLVVNNCPRFKNSIKILPT